MRKKVGILLKDIVRYYFFCLNCGEYYEKANSTERFPLWKIWPVYEDQLPPSLGQKCHETFRRNCMGELMPGLSLYETYEEMTTAKLGDYRVYEENFQVPNEGRSAGVQVRVGVFPAP